MKNQIELITNHREIELLDSKRKIIIQELFTEKGMDLIISEIEKEVENFSADISTKQGQTAIKSMAAKVARCKSPIKDLAMELKEDSRKLINDVNSQYNRYEAAMDALRDKIRKPVDEIEEHEEKLLAEKKDRIERIKNHGMLYNSTLQDISVAINNAKEILDFDNWGEFQFAAESTAKKVIQDLEILFKQKEDQIKKDAELEQLRKEAAERAQKDHEEKIAREAEEKAKREAEQRAVKAELELKTSNRKQDLLDLGMTYDQAEDAFTFSGLKIFFKTAIALSDKHWNEELHEIEYEIEKHKKAIAQENRIAAERKAKEDAEKAATIAVEAERARVEAQRKADEAAAEKLAANKRHCAKINNEAISSLFEVLLKCDFDLSDGQSLAKRIVEAIARREVANVSIKY